jgi:hypothetical protein
MRGSIVRQSLNALDRVFNQRTHGEETHASLQSYLEPEDDDKIGLTDLNPFAAATSVFLALSGLLSQKTQDSRSEELSS